jgi:hypothetical protein
MLPITCSIFILLLISIFSSLGISIAIVEKGENWPIKPIKDILSKILIKIHKEAPNVLECVLCSSFWASLIIDSSLFFITGGTYFLWPISGFISLFFAWFFIEFLNSIDRRNLN